MTSDTDSVQASVESAGLLTVPSTPTRDWHAWNNLMPPKPDDFHVTGWVQVPNPGVDPALHYRHPQGINPVILILDLVLFQRPGIWPQMLVWKQVRYDEVPTTANHLSVDIQSGGQSIAQIKVENIH